MNCAYKTASHCTSMAALARHYHLNPLHLPKYLHPMVRPLHADEETGLFLSSCKPRWMVDTAADFLRSCFSVTDVNGLLGRGQMFVLSKAQVRDLLGEAMEAARASHPGQPVRLLDVGAGDGEVTTRLASVVDSVTATEVSWAMARRLRSRGYTVSQGPLITRECFPQDGEFDVVTLMNLLDRCDHPMGMVRDAARLMRRGTGRLLIALVLPFSEFVEEGSKRRAVRAPLPMGGARCGDGATLEVSLSTFIQRVVYPLGLEVERLARVPYLCRGDTRQPFYVLSDALLVLRHRVGDIPKEVEWEGDFNKAEAGDEMERCNRLSYPEPLQIKLRER